MITKKKKCQRGGASAPKQTKTPQTQKPLSTIERRANRVHSIDSTSKKTPSYLSQKYKQFRAYTARNNTKTALGLQGQTFRNKHSFFGYGKTTYQPSEERKAYNELKKAKSDLHPSKYRQFINSFKVDKSVPTKTFAQRFTNLAEAYNKNRKKSSVQKNIDSKRNANNKAKKQKAFNNAKNVFANKMGIDQTKLDSSTKKTNIINMAAKSAANTLRQKYENNKSKNLTPEEHSKLYTLESSERLTNAYKKGKQAIENRKYGTANTLRTPEAIQEKADELHEQSEKLRDDHNAFIANFEGVKTKLGSNATEAVERFEELRLAQHNQIETEKNIILKQRDIEEDRRKNKGLNAALLIDDLDKLQTQKTTDMANIATKQIEYEQKFATLNSDPTNKVAADTLRNYAEKNKKLYNNFAERLADTANLDAKKKLLIERGQKEAEWITNLQRDKPGKITDYVENADFTITDNRGRNKFAKGLEQPITSDNDLTYYKENLRKIKEDLILNYSREKFQKNRGLIQVLNARVREYEYNKYKNEGNTGTSFANVPIVDFFAPPRPPKTPLQGSLPPQQGQQPQQQGQPRPTQVQPLQN